jgi:hypothetical protein
MLSSAERFKMRGEKENKKKWKIDRDLNGRVQRGS